MTEARKSFNVAIKDAENLLMRFDNEQYSTLEKKLKY